MIDITINFPDCDPAVSLELQTIATATLEYMNTAPDTSISILITDDSELRQLNNQFRMINRVTDVLSFENDLIDPETGEHRIGDIAISYPRAALQAKDAGHSVLSELCLLVVHGVLHLLGCDHDTEENKEEMWFHQSAVLKAQKIIIRSISGDAVASNEK